MKDNITILDCTLRDGGYVNDWLFGHDVIQSIYRRLDSAGVDYIEVGFLDDRRPFDINRTIFPDTESLDKVFAGVEKHHAIPVAMIDFGTCDIENIAPADQSFIDGIRVIFKKEKIEQALPFCKKIKEKGYKLFIQAISITAYSDSEMLDYVKKINEIKPYAFSIVDTYGLLDNKSMARYFYLIDNNLDPEILMGYHEHNNFQLGFSNTIKFIGKDTNRNLCADSTIYGMGKSAGNCPTELLAMQLNADFGKNYDLTQILEIIDTSILPIYLKKYWGYKLDFYIASMHKCHPSYVKYLLDKKTLSISSVDKILSIIPDKKRLLYDAQWIENAYYDFQNNEIEDSHSYGFLNECLMGGDDSRIILIGPGESAQKFGTKDIGKKDVVVSINFIPRHMTPDFVFVSNAKRYVQILDEVPDFPSEKIIITSNITPIGAKLHQMLNYASLVSMHKVCRDNSLLLFLSVLVRLGVKSVSLVGFDGFAEKSRNYLNETMAFNNVDSAEFNQAMSNELTQLSQKIHLEFITPTRYVIG